MIRPTRRQIEQRMAKLHELFDHGPGQVAAGMNVDASKLPDVEGVPKPVPSIDHTISACGCCDEPIWLGPRQLALCKEGGAIPLCYWCAVILQRAMPVSQEIISLNPGIDQRPRRR